MRAFTDGLNGIVGEGFGSCCGRRASCLFGGVYFGAREPTTAPQVAYIASH